MRCMLLPFAFEGDMLVDYRVSDVEYDAESPQRPSMGIVRPLRFHILSNNFLGVGSQAIFAFS